MGKTFSFVQPLEWMWWQRWLLGLFVVGTAAVLYFLFLRVWVDPQPNGRLQVAQRVVPQSIPAYSQQVFWLPEEIAAEAYTVVLTAAFGGGERDMRYGLVIGQPEEYLEVVLSPLGYAAVNEVTAEEIIPLRTMSPFPHVRDQKEVNEFWITVVEGQGGTTAVTVRLNREILWQGELSVWGDQIALIGESYGAVAHIEFQQLQLYYEPSSGSK